MIFSVICRIVFSFERGEREERKRYLDRLETCSDTTISISKEVAANAYNIPLYVPTLYSG